MEGMLQRVMVYMEHQVRAQPDSLYTTCAEVRIWVVNLRPLALCSPLLSLSSPLCSFAALSLPFVLTRISATPNNGRLYQN